MTEKEYHEAIYRAAEISKELTLMLNERGQDLFEEYVNVYEKIIIYEMR